MIRRWIKQENNIRTFSKNKNCVKRSEAKWPDLEKQVGEWVTQQRSNGRAVSTVRIKLMAKEMAKNANISDFKASNGWCQKFMKRNKLSVRVRTTVGQKLPEMWEQKCADFTAFTRQIVAENNFTLSQIGNMDELPMTFDAPMNRTVSDTGDKTVKISTTGNEKTSFTVVLSCMADGTKLKPLEIFKRVTMLREQFPRGVVVTVNKKGWMTTEIMNTWIESVWRTRPNAFFQPQGMLVLDSMRAHITEEVKHSFAQVRTPLAVIPGGLTCKLQPLDISVNHAFKVHIRNEWERWMSDGMKTYTASGRMRRASYAEVTTWITTAWEKIKRETIMNAF